MADPKPLTRDQLAKFLPDQEAIKRFERLFAVAGDLTPTDVATLYRLTQEASTDAGIADSKANEALDALNRIAASLDLLAKAPLYSKDTFLAGDYIDVSTTAPTAVGATGRLKWNDTDGTLDLGLKGGNVTLQLGQENVLRVKNDEATALSDGEVVYITGASGANLLVKRALADSDVTSASTIGVVTESIGVNGQGFITTFGQVRGLNTSTFNEGDVLYLSPTVAGAITTTKPVAPQHMVLVGYCTKKSAGNGEIFVKVDNGYEIDELHNVRITNPVLAGSLLIYDATVGVWKNARLTAGTNVAITNADGSITIAVAGAPPTGAAGGVLSGTYPNPGFAVDMATQAELDAHTGNTSNPHSVTKTQVGLGNVTNDAQLKIASNLSDLANAATARSNLGVAIGSNVQAWDADLDAIAALAGTSGLLKKTAANTWSLDTTSYAPTASPTLTGTTTTDTLTATGIVTAGKSQTTTMLNVGDNTTVGTRFIAFQRAAALTDIVNIQGIAAGLGPADIKFQAQGGNVGFACGIYPVTDNTYSVGYGSFRWSVIYAATGTINTSDARTKTDISELNDAECRVALKIKRLIKRFKFRDAVDAKGSSARYHFGVIAQEVIEAFKSEGLDANCYGLVCYDRWDDQFEEIYSEERHTDDNGVEHITLTPTGEFRQIQVAGDRYGIRYEELLAFVISSI